MAQALTAFLLFGLVLAGFQANLILGAVILIWMAWIGALAWDRHPAPEVEGWENEGGYISPFDDLKVHRCWNCNRPVALSAIRCPHCGAPQRRGGR